MIKAFISKVGEGKTLCAIAECAMQKNKKVAYITTELPSKFILNRFSIFNPKCEKLVVLEMPTGSPAIHLYAKIKKLSEEFDLICVDCPQLCSGVNLQDLDDACFGSFMNQCEDLWITAQANRGLNMTDHELVKKTEKKNLLSIKQICESIESPLLPGEKLIRAIDLETKEIKTYNLNNLYKK